MKTWINKIRDFIGKWERPNGTLLQQEGNIGTGAIGEEKSLKDGEDNCPYCKSKRFFRRGKRKKKLEIVQLYQC